MNRSGASTRIRWQVVVLAEHGDDIGRLVLTHQAVVDEDAGQLVADCLMDQQGRNGRVDAAGQAADDCLVADLLADAVNGLLTIGGHRPVALDAGDAWTKFSRSLAPSGVCTTSGWNCTA